MREPFNMARTSAEHSRERGFGLVEIVVVMCLLTVGICTAALVCAKGLVQARHARVRTDARTAASILANAQAPAAAGGSVSPSSVIEGWFDVVVVDPSTGTLTVVSGSVPEGAIPIRRQWRLEVSGRARVYSVSAEILAPDASTPLPAAQGGGVFYFSRVVG